MGESRPSTAVQEIEPLLVYLCFFKEATCITASNDGSIYVCGMNVRR